MATPNGEQVQHNISESLKGFVVSGYIPEEDARVILRMDENLRTEQSSDLTVLDDPTLKEGEKLRLDWLTRQLGNTPLNETVFLTVTTRRPQIVPGSGMGPRYTGRGGASTNGRHSSPYTSAVDDYYH